MLARTRSLWKARNRSCNDHETDPVDGVAENEWPTTSNLIDEEHCAGLSNNGEDITDSLVFQCISGADVERCIDLGSEVLYRAHSCHLNRSLQGTHKHETSKARSIGKEITISLGGLFVLDRDGLLNLAIFCLYPRVILVATRMQSCKRFQSELFFSVVYQPTG